MQSRIRSSVKIIRPYRMAGTFAFFSPEMCSGDSNPFNNDLWALAITLYAFVYGRVPWYVMLLRSRVVDLQADHVIRATGWLMDRLIFFTKLNLSRKLVLCA